jgi:dolichol-phosphate mannosyltransferase
VSADSPSLAVVVPVFNEEVTIASAIRRIAAVAERYRGQATVIGVDDGSSDGSLEALEGVAETVDLLQVVSHATNRGYGAALRTGTARANELGFDFVAFIDSDLTNPPEDLLVIGELAARGHDYIKASRFIPGGRMEGVPRSRRIFSVAGNRVARLLFGCEVRDVTNGFRGGRAELIGSWPLREPGFAVIVEELDWALRSGIEPVEFPTVLRTRTDDQRPTAFGYSIGQILSYLRYPLRSFWRRIRRRERSEVG